MAETEVQPLEINDALFCPHWKEVCTECPGFDTREENDAYLGWDPIDRQGIECEPAILTKDGTYQCKKHGTPSQLFPMPVSLQINIDISVDCNQCYNWKKILTRARAAAKKAGKK
ncbi:hypothetical protein CYLTODRAFT_290244 [Cylindrobasidium torrendii FP15055 ss-10]|uniref:Uncharacterized protein n=1 Tax=Cylindrobasidium torrendii FP15055 ss-10 TaxID=1314674 RepID=A0A0D7BBK3_9AGAR|nr:hypothetical protein CYLTODRAFT_290244 [Cylindrobasidium torrendii FP15055 ss-10]